MAALSTFRLPGSRRSFNKSLLACLFAPALALAQTLPPGCELGELGTVSLTMSEDQQPWFEARINGNAVIAIPDVGSQSATSLGKKTLERLGVKVRSSESTYAGIDVMNSLIASFEVGPIKSKGWFVVTDFPTEELGARVGANYLLQSDLEISLDQGYMRFFKPKGCARASLAYWSSTAVSVPTDVHQQRKDLRPWFKVRINGQDIWAVISTTSPVSYLDLFTAKRMGLTPQSEGATEEESIIGWRDRKQRVWRLPAPAMSIGDLEVRDVDLRLVNLDLSGEILVLGTDFLRRHRVYIAMGQRRIYFSPVSSTPPADRAVTGTVAAP